MAGTITIKNDSDTDLIFSDFNAGDDFAPFDHKTIAAHTSGDLNAGDFECLGVGVQTQSGGVWVSSPKAGPFVKANHTVTWTMTKVVTASCGS